MITIEGTIASAIVFHDTIKQDVHEQIRNICSHPMARSAKIRIMPDCHAGAGCVIGFTAVLSEKCIVPNVVGVDIGCGVLTAEFHAPNGLRFQELNDFIEAAIPHGLGNRSTMSPYVAHHPEVRDCVAKVCSLIHNESKEESFLLSCGSLGGGNHFIEIDHAGDDRYLLTVHTGSRSLGNSICGYYQKHGSLLDPLEKERLLEKHRYAKTPEEHQAIQDAVNALTPVESDLAFVTGRLYDEYIECMLAAKDFAAANRAAIAQEILDHLERTDRIRVEGSFDTVHNYIDWYSDEKKQIIVRKGAISALSGQRLCIPLNMRDGIIIGRGKGNPEWNYSAPHGAGRQLSRKQARRELKLTDYQKSMQGIHSWSVNENTLDEAPMVYKNPEDIIRRISDTVDIEYIAKTVYNFKAYENWSGWKR